MSDIVVLDRGNYTSCTVNLHGATVVSWRFNNQEQLFVSQRAIFDDKSPIVGGIPITFPQFGPWTFGPHDGFARIMRWDITTPPRRLANGDIEAIFSIADNNFTRSMWSNQFQMTYRLVLREKALQLNIGILNPSHEFTFSFHLSLNTYFKVAYVPECLLSGLEGCTFIDKILNEDQYSDENLKALRINRNIDRIYPNTSPELVITRGFDEHKIRIEKYNFPDTMVWNPWKENAQASCEMGDDEYLRMICVGVGHVTNPVVLQPGFGFEASHILQLL